MSHGNRYLARVRSGERTCQSLIISDDYYSHLVYAINQSMRHYHHRRNRNQMVPMAAAAANPVQLATSFAWGSAEQETRESESQIERRHSSTTDLFGCPYHVHVCVGMDHKSSETGMAHPPITHRLTGSEEKGTSRTGFFFLSLSLSCRVSLLSSADGMACHCMGWKMGTGKKAMTLLGLSKPRGSQSDPALLSAGVCQQENKIKTEKKKGLEVRFIRQRLCASG